MEYPNMRLRVGDGLARLTFTEPQRGNPIDGAFCANLRAIAIELGARRDVRAVLISAEGKAFSVGGDISTFTAGIENLPRNIALWAGDLHDAIARLQRIDAPCVAAVHGICVGGMTAFVAGADYVVASAEARFGAAYSRIGFSCDAGASVMLSRRMGQAKARRFLLLGEELGAEAAFAAGLVDEVTASGLLTERAEAVAASFAVGPTLAYGEVKRLFLTVETSSLEEQLALEALSLARTAASEDARNALVAFKEKRRPDFGGK